MKPLNIMQYYKNKPASFRDAYKLTLYAQILRRELMFNYAEARGTHWHYFTSQNFGLYN